MSVVKYMFNAKLSRFYKAIKIVADDNNRSPFLMYLDFVYCGIVYKSGLCDYINYKFYLKSAKERKAYVTVIDCDNFYKIASPAQYKTFFTIKPEFIENFRKYIDRDYCTYDKGLKVFKTFVRNHDSFFLKPIDGLGGHEVEKVYSKDIKDINKLYDELHTDRKFVEEAVIQHRDMSKLSPTSVNTIRIMTYANNGKSEIFFAAVRVGNGKNAVDNFHQGGMGALVDINTGKITGKAVNKIDVWFDKHPVTHIKFDGYQLPNWDYVKKMVLEAALVNKDIHVVGWDVAITENGATFIEGNRRPGWDLVQQLYQRGRNDITKRILKDLKKNK